MPLGDAAYRARLPVMTEDDRRVATDAVRVDLPIQVHDVPALAGVLPNATPDREVTLFVFVSTRNLDDPWYRTAVDRLRGVPRRVVWHLHEDRWVGQAVLEPEDRETVFEVLETAPSSVREGNKGIRRALSATPARRARVEMKLFAPGD